MLLIVIQVCLLALVFTFPKDGIPLGDVVIQFSNPKDFYQEKKRELKIIQEVSENYTFA